MAEKRKYTITLDDDPTMAPVIAQATGMESLAFTSVPALLAEAGRRDPVAVFVDIHIGGDCGLDAVPRLREKWLFCPIVVITADPADDAVTRALASGADDFVMKPIRPAELLARLQARLGDAARREAKSVIRMGDVLLDVSHRVLRGKHVRRNLSETETKLLQCLWSAQGTVVPRETLKWQGWGEAAVSDNSLNRKLHELRKALKETSDVVSLHNQYGEGFAMRLISIKPKVAAGASSLLDEKKIASLCALSEDGTPDFFTELTGIFLADAPPVLEELGRAVRAGDADGVKRHAHKLKGMCFNLGASSLSALCESLEDLGRRAELAGCEMLLRRLEQEYPRVEAALRARCARAA